MTRMWMVNPKYLCRNHLLGEHKEIHQLIGSILKNKSIQGFIDNGLVEVHNTETRHRDLVKEMLKRGYNHKSDLPYFIPSNMGEVNIKKSLKDLKERCKECRALIENEDI